MPIDKDIYSIHAVRLVNFHNINHVVLPIRNGGHLFLLGDNGSGKTTVLDAIHYVLSAGDQVELNSAARLGGNKLDGRKINGVVTRVNVDTGPMCPEGRVTYAALELRNPAGHVQSIGIGLSIAGENAPLSQWGFRIESPVEQLPLLVRDTLGEEYPPDRDECRKLMQRMNGHYYQSMNSFANAMAKNFFPGPSQYDEYRKFLNMCKAYREISSRAGNYHELFKSLLPEPEQELIQDLRIKLKALRESSADLNALAKKCGYLRELNADRIAIDKIRDDIHVLTLGLHWFDRRHHQAILKKATEKAQQLLLEQNQQQERCNQANDHLTALERALTDLKGKDDTSLIETEKARTRELHNQDARLNALNDRNQDAQNQRTQLQQAYAQTDRTARKSLAELAGKLASNLGNWQELPLEPAMDALQNAQKGALENLDSQPLHALGNAFGGALAREQARLQELNGRVDTARDARNLAQQDLETLKKQGETYPGNLPDYPSVLKELDQQFLQAEPLFLKLHWNQNVTPAQRAAVEEIIGEDVLGTLVAEEATAEKIRAFLIATNRKGYRCANLNEPNLRQPSPAVLHFLDKFFDSSRDVTFLSVLAREMDGATVPELEEADAIRFVNWRGSFRMLHGTPARLIGEEERKAERQRLISQAEQRCQQAEKALRDTEDKRTAQDKRLQALMRFAERYGLLFNGLEEATRTLQDLTQKQQAQDDYLNRLTAELQEQTQIRQELLQLVERLRQQIKDKNLEALNAQITELTRTCEDARQTAQQARDSWVIAQSKYQTQLQDCQQFSLEAEQAAQILQEELQNSAICHTEESLQKRLADRNVRKKDDCNNQLALLKQDVARHQGNIATRINTDQGVDYGFVYLEDDNELFTREHVTLADLLERLEKELAQQQEILNENTRTNFERILLELFRDSLRRRIYGLEHMHVLINRMLKGHQFGGNTYSLKLQPVPDYAPLVRVIRSFSEQFAESTDELKDIFDKNAHEILETPANRIPDILDYRNYYRYEMLLHTAGSNGRVMDSRTKSVGSGGEQAVPNYLLVMMIAHLLFDKTEGTQSRIKINCLLFDEAFYGIDQQRQDQLLAFAEDLGLQLVIASPNQDGIKPELANSTNVFVLKDTNYNVHLRAFDWKREQDLFQPENQDQPIELT